MKKEDTVKDWRREMRKLEPGYHNYHQLVGMKGEEEEERRKIRRLSIEQRKGARKRKIKRKTYHLQDWSLGPG